MALAAGYIVFTLFRELLAARVVGVYLRSECVYFEKGFAILDQIPASRPTPSQIS